MQVSTPRRIEPMIVPPSRNSLNLMREYLRNSGPRVFTLSLAQHGFPEGLRIAVSLVDSDNNNNTNNNDGNADTSGSSTRTEPQQRRQGQQTSRSRAWPADEVMTRATRRERRRRRLCDHDEKTFCAKCHTRRRHNDYRWYGRPYKLN